MSANLSSTQRITKTVCWVACAIVRRAINGNTQTTDNKRRLGVYLVAIKGCDVRYQMLLLLQGFGYKSFGY